MKLQNKTTPKTKPKSLLLLKNQHFHQLYLKKKRTQRGLHHVLLQCFLAAGSPPMQMAELLRHSLSVLMLGLEARSASHYSKTPDGRL